MAEPYSDEHQEIAEEILGRAFGQLEAAGLGGVEACHALVHMGVDTMPAFACRHHLGGELEAMLEAIQDRINEIPTMVPGVDIAICSEDAH